MKESDGPHVNPNSSANSTEVSKLVRRYLPKRIAKVVGSTAMAVSAMFYGGAVCGEEEKIDQNVTEPATSSQRYNPDAFLRIPIPRDPEAQIVQGWRYSTIIGGTRDHFATDFILGTDLNNADTWKRFPVLVGADGVACAGSYETSDHGEGNYIQIAHNNGYKTRYLHNEEGSLSDRDFPLCTQSVGEWLAVRQGDKLANAGDAGTPEGWIHAHWEVIDPNGRKVDPYDLYTTREAYPDPNFLNGKLCGEKTLIVNCPVGVASRADAQLRPTIELEPTLELISTLEPVPTLPRIPTTEAIRERYQDLDPYDPAQRAEWASLVEQKGIDLAWQFVNYLSSGTPDDLEAAHAMQIPDNLKLARYEAGRRYRKEATLDLLQRCSLGMDVGQTRDIQVDIPIGHGVSNRLTQNEIYNLQNNIDRDRFEVYVSFTHNDRDANGNELGAKRFDINAPYVETFIIFEVANNEVYIAEPRFCTYELSPLNN